jgi:hypothetical protein
MHIAAAEESRAEEKKIHFYEHSFISMSQKCRKKGKARKRKFVIKFALMLIILY